MNKTLEKFSQLSYQLLIRPTEWLADDKTTMKGIEDLPVPISWQIYLFIHLLS